jgi:GNAT superfamily N-acetyltransferase
MKHRFGTESDLDLLAEWNHQLIRDEGHRNPMTVSQLRARMQGWLAGAYKAVLFDEAAEPVAYALYREDKEEIYLRQLFVKRGCRRQGIGREVVKILEKQVWPPGKRQTVEALTANASAVSFWRSVGYSDYCLTLEKMPKESGEPGAGADADHTCAS